MSFESLMEKFEQDMAGRQICENMDVLHESNLQHSFNETYVKFKGILEQYKTETVLNNRTEFKELCKNVEKVEENLQQIKQLIETFHRMRG